MRNPVLKLICFVGILSCTSCSHEIFSGAMQTSPVKIDAKINDWEIPLRFYDEGTQINYSVTNDKSNLYVCMRITDVVMQTKIMRAGMELWIDTTAKKKKDIGISFPLSTGEKVKYDAQNGINYPDTYNGNKHDQLRTRGNFLASNREMQLKGFKPPLTGFVPVRSDSSGIAISMNWDSTSTLIYEARIPFKTFYKPALTAADSAKVFSLGIILNAITVVTPSSGNQPQAMNPAGGGMGMNSGTLGNNSRLSGMEEGTGGIGHGKDYNAFANPKKIWLRIKLAVK